MGSDWTKIDKMCEPELDEPDRHAQHITDMIEIERVEAELAAAMAECTVHTASNYSDPEADGCPNCGWGGK